MPELDGLTARVRETAEKNAGLSRPVLPCRRTISNA